MTYRCGGKRQLLLKATNRPVYYRPKWLFFSWTLSFVHQPFFIDVTDGFTNRMALPSTNPKPLFLYRSANWPVGVNAILMSLSLSVELRGMTCVQRSIVADWFVTLVFTIAPSMQAYNWLSPGLNASRLTDWP